MAHKKRKSLPWLAASCINDNDEGKGVRVYLARVLVSNPRTEIAIGDHFVAILLDPSVEQMAMPVYRDDEGTFHISTRSVGYLNPAGHRELLKTGKTFYKSRPDLRLDFEMVGKKEKVDVPTEIELGAVA